MNNNVVFNQELLDKCYYLFYSTTVLKLSDDQSHYYESENNIGNHVTIYRTSWEYEDGKSFYSNEEFEVFMQQEIQDQIDFWVNEMHYTQEEAEKEIFRERVVTISYRG